MDGRMISKIGKRKNKPADHGNGQWLMQLRAGSDAQGQRHQGNDGADGGHQFGPQSGGNGIYDGIIYRIFLSVNPGIAEK